MLIWNLINEFGKIFAYIQALKRPGFTLVYGIPESGIPSDKIARLEAQIRDLEHDLEMEKILHQAANKERLRLQDKIDSIRGLYDQPKQ